MLFREAVAVYCENHKKHTDTLCGLNAEFWFVKAGGTNSNRWAFKGYGWPLYRRTLSHQGAKAVICTPGLDFWKRLELKEKLEKYKLLILRTEIISRYPYIVSILER
jgi:hypothetical protein